jgi:phosphohistidine swiveling domain-containing protein
MSLAVENNDYYFSGGLAEFVSNPTPLTFSFFSHWFTGAESLGKAMNLLGLPYKPLSLPILFMQGDGVVVDLKQEEKTLYKHTLFSYRPQKSIHDTPRLSLQIFKLIDPQAWINTAKITKKQSEWIAFPQETVDFAQALMKNATLPPSNTIQEEDILLASHIWPIVISIGILCEFYYQFLEKEYASRKVWQQIQAYISSEVAEKDWFFTSFSDQIKVKEGKMDFEEYLKLYGVRSEKDYELANPRWEEQKETVKSYISQAKMPPVKEKAELPANLKYKEIIQSYISLLELRSEAKHLVLLHIKALRKRIIEQAKTDQIAALERKAILQGDFSPQKIQKILNPPKIEQKNQTEGKGIGVAAGNVQAQILHITETTTIVPADTLCIFPNASPQFSLLYPNCKGMIFLKGGQTSHGAIVAREYGIPAIIDSQAASFPNGQLCQISGESGSWSIQKSSK